MPSKRSKVIEDVRTEDPTAELTVDLHIGRIPGSDGILASAVRKELDEVFAVSCSYTFGPMGVTNVTIR